MIWSIFYKFFYLNFSSRNDYYDINKCLFVKMSLQYGEKYLFQFILILWLLSGFPLMLINLIWTNNQIL